MSTEIKIDEDSVEYYINLVPEKDDHFAHIMSEIFGPDIGGIIMRFIPQVRSNVTNAEMVAAANMGDYRTFICGVFQYCQGLYPAINAIIVNRHIFMVDLVIALITRWEINKKLSPGEAEYILTHMILCATRTQNKKYAWEVYKKVDREIIIPCDYMVDKTKPNAKELSIKLQCKFPFITYELQLYFSKYGTKMTTGSDGIKTEEPSGYDYLSCKTAHGCMLYIRHKQDFDILEDIINRSSQLLGTFDYLLILNSAWNNCSLEYLLKVKGICNTESRRALLRLAIRNNDTVTLTECIKVMKIDCIFDSVVEQELSPWTSIECIEIILNITRHYYNYQNYISAIISKAIRYGHDIIPLLNKIKGRKVWTEYLSVETFPRKFTYTRRFIERLKKEHMEMPLETTSEIVEDN